MLFIVLQIVVNIIKNIFVHPNTITYNSLYKAMGNSTTSSDWNATLKTF
jgi:hypothetical protein